MSLLSQNIDPNRYVILPRTLTFLAHQDEFLLIRKNQPGHPWAGKLNAIGGHIESGEDALSAAKREVLEETGLTPNQLQFCGTVLIDTGQIPGVGLYVFMGEVESRRVVESPEGETIWVDLAEIASLPVLEDLPELLMECLKCSSSGSVFSWAYRFDELGKLSIHRG